MADGAGFAHYEFPTNQPVNYGDTTFPHYQFPTEEGDLLGVEAGSLIELASGEYNRAFESPERHMEAIGRSRQGSSFHHEVDQILERQDQQSVRAWQMGEAQKQAESRAAGWVPWELQSLGGGGAAAVESVGAAIMRTIDPETSDWMVRATQAKNMGLDLGMTKEELSETRKFVNTNLYGAARSWTQAALAAGAAYYTGGSSFAYMATGFAATTANESYVEAIDYGLTPKKAFSYAWKQGAFEAGVMTAFQVAGLGGFEKMVSGGLGKSLWAGLNKEFGKQFLAEMTEEQITTVLQELSRAASMPDAKNPSAWMGEDGTFETSAMRKAMIATAAQTIFMMGGPKAAGVAGRGGAKAWSFLIDPSRSSVLVMPDGVRDPLTEKHGDLNKKENRDAASDDLWLQYVGILDGKKETEDEIDYWRSVADNEGRTDKAREAAAGVASRLDGGEYEAKNANKELLELISERMSKREPEGSAKTATIPAPAVSQERKHLVPQVILQQDPNAEIVDHLDLVPKDAKDSTVVKMLSVVKELSRESRGGRDIRFVQTEDPSIKGLYSGDGIYITIPKIKKYMKDGELDEEGLRKALTGTFAHEFSHELAQRNPKVWKKLFASLKGDGKYGKILEQGRRDFLEQFEKAESLDVDPYAKYRGEENADALKDLADEESLSYLMDDHFITTGLVAKMAKTDSNAFEMLRDWLRRIRNSLFGDKLYRGMTSAFNEVASDMGIQPIATRPVTEPSPKKTRKKARKKSAKRSRKHVLKKGLPEWAEKPVEDLDKRGSKVVQKNHASPTSVVVTVQTKAGNTQIVTLRSVSGRAAGIEKTVVKATNENYNDRMEDAVAGAVAFDESVQEEADEAGEEQETEPETITDALNDDLDKMYGGLREGYTDEDGGAEVESTDIDAFVSLAAELGKQDENGPYLEGLTGMGSRVDIDGLRERGLAFEDEDGKFRLTSLGERVMAWEGADEVGEFGEPDELDQYLGERFSLEYRTNAKRMLEDAYFNATPFFKGSEEAGIETLEDLLAMKESENRKEGILWLSRELAGVYARAENEDTRKTIWKELKKIPGISIESGTGYENGAVILDDGFGRTLLARLKPDEGGRLSLAIEGLDDKDVELMELAILTADIAITKSPYTGRAFDLIEEIWDGDLEGEISGWLRKNKPDALKDVVNTVWNEHHEGILKKYGGKLSRFVPMVRKRMISGKYFSGEISEWNLLRRAKSVVPQPNEYRQLGDSSERLSIKIHDMEFPEEYHNAASKHHVDQRTRDAVDKVSAHAHIRTPKETRTHLQDEVWGQSRFNKDPLGTIKYLIRKGLQGEIFTSRDLVMLELSHKHILSIIDAGNLTAAEMEDLTQQKIWLAQYSNESHSEWGRAGSMMRDRVESVRERQQRAIDRAMFSIPNNLKRRLAWWQGRLTKGHPQANEKVAEIRKEWHQANLDVENKLRAKGWDLSQLDKYMGSREAVEAFVYEVMKEKGEVGTVGHIIYEVFVNFILSGPLTHAANISSNVLMNMYEFGPKRHAHALLNEVSLAVGLGDKMAPRIGELPHLYAAAWRGFMEGAKHARRTMVSEEGEFERSLGVEQGRAAHTYRGYHKHITGAKGRVVRAFGTTGLNALDSWQKSVNAHMEVVALAYRDAKVNGLVDDQVGEYMENVQNDKSHRLWSDALVKARDMVFQGEPSNVARGVLTFRANTPGVKWLLPFILTPDNILRKGVGYSPLGAFTLPIGAYKGFTTGDWSTMGERSVQQLIAWSVVAAMWGDDDERPFITGTVPSQPKEWAGQSRSDTIPAMSIRVGDGYFSYARFEPFATWLALSKDLVSSLKHGDPGFTQERMGESLVELFKDKTYMRAVADLGYFLQNSKQGSRRIAGGFITSAVPNLYKQIVRAGRDTKLERRDWGDDGRLEMWAKNLIRKAELPFYEEYDKYDQYGKKIPENWNPFSGTKSSFWYNLLVPAKGKHVHEGVADKVLRRFNDQNPDKRMGIQELNPYFLIKKERQYLTKEEYEEYTKLTGSIFGKLADSEAVDFGEPKEGEVADLWRSNWKAARSASQEILKRKWAGEPYEDEAKVVAQQIYENNINKRIRVLGHPNLVLWKQDDETKKLPQALRKQKLDVAQKELLEQKTEAVEWLVRQGYTADNFPKLTSRKYSPSRGRALKSFRNLSGGVEGVRKRTVPPRVKAAR